MNGRFGCDTATDDNQENAHWPGETAMPIDDFAAKHLQAFEQGGDFPGGLAFRPELQKCQLDYSLDSIARLDRLLETIRLQLKPEFDSFIADQAKQNFLNFVCFYTGAVMGRASGLQVRWYQYEEMVPILRNLGKEFPQCYATFLACALGPAQYVFPLGAIQEMVFEKQPGQTLHQLVEQTRRTGVGPQTLIKRPAGKPVPGAGAHHQAAELLGFVSAWGIQIVAGGAPLMPMLFEQSNTLRTLMYEKPAEAIAAGQKELHDNPQRAQRLALIYDGFITTDGERRDALIVEARAYSTPFRLQVAVPYKPAVRKMLSRKTGFAVYPPNVRECTADAGEWPSIFESFYAGVERCNGGREIWAAHLQEPA
jgi:hypothetical protein